MSYFESPERRPRRPVRACSRSPKKSFGLAFDHGQLAAACFGTRSHTKRQASVSSASSVLTGSTPSPKSSRASTPSQEMDGLGAANCSTLTRLKKTWSPLERLPVEVCRAIIREELHLNFSLSQASKGYVELNRIGSNSCLYRMKFTFIF